MRSRILGARVIDPASGLDQVRDLYLDGGKLAAFDQAPAGFVADQDIDARGLIASPGLVDLSVALREPGYSRKGNIASETLAAAAGGVTSLCCPPLTKPVLDTPAVAELILDRAQEAGHTKVFPIGALTQQLGGEKPCIPERKKDFSTPRSCSGFDDILKQHAATARNDGERDGLIHQVYRLHRCGSFGLSSSQDSSIHPAPLARPFSKGLHSGG